MEKEFLEDYEQKEHSEYVKFRKKVLEGKFDSKKERYPPNERFRKLKEPVAIAHGFGSIWPQIPLFGSMIIPIFPRDKEHFQEIHGFEANDIERLVDFAKDTGKIQFALRAHPTAYLGFDFLEPIFTELRPPLSVVYPFEDVIEKKEIKKYTIEFYTLAGFGLLDHIKGTYLRLGEEYTKKRIDDYLRDYILLKSLGYDDIVDNIEEAMVCDLSEALGMYAAFGNLITEPKISPLRATEVYSREYILKLFQIGRGMEKFEQEIQGMRFNYDIGKFLMSKLTCMPEGYQACIDVIHRYKQEGLYKVAEALDKGIKEERKDEIYEKKNELETILDKVWEDGRLQMRKEGIKYGILTSLGIIGTLVVGGPATGILAGLGFSVVDRIMGINTEKISEKFAKIIAPNHCVAIYDFKKKYKIKE